MADLAWLGIQSHVLLHARVPTLLDQGCVVSCATLLSESMLPKQSQLSVAMLNPVSAMAKNVGSFSAAGILHGAGPFRDLDEQDLLTIFDKPIYLEIIASDAFQRLKEIRFLGAIDYLVTPRSGLGKKRHTRYQHSLRVGQLAIQYARLCKLEARAETLLAIAALLHDIGHAPLSHSLEPAFKLRFDMNHHSVSKMIIYGKIPLGNQLPIILRRYRITPDEVINLLEGKTPAPYVEAFKNPINIDTIEAITRSYSYLVPRQVALAPTTIISALVRKDELDVPILDAFWNLKDTVYNQLISSKFGLLADFVCQQYMNDYALNFWKGSYLQSEPQFRKKHKKLFELLREIKNNARQLIPTKDLTITFQRRRFVVDKSVPINVPADMYRRYKQTKSTEVMHIEN